MCKILTAIRHPDRKRIDRRLLEEQTCFLFEYLKLICPIGGIFRFEATNLTRVCRWQEKTVPFTTKFNQILIISSFFSRNKYMK